MLGQETSDEPDVIGGADMGQIPQRMVQHDEDFGILVERLQQSRQLAGVRTVGMADNLAKISLARPGGRL